LNVSELFIRRPVMTALIMLSILIAGITGYRLLPVSDLPSVDFPTILVTASLPGASPETMAAAVATPLEKQFSTIAGLSSMNSTSALGAAQITLQFDLDKSLDSAALDVQSMIARAQPQLPRDMPSPPSFQKVNPADQPILYLALSSPTLPMSQVDEYAEVTMAQRISMVRGVALVQVFGAQKFAVRVQVDPSALAARSIGIDEVTTAIQNANVELPTGVLQGSERAYTVDATGQLLQAASYMPMIIQWRDGKPVRLRDVGRAIDSVENDKVASFYNRTRAIVLAIQRQPGTNTVAVVDEIHRLMPAFREQIPGSVVLDVLFDRSVSIRQSVSDVQLTLVLTIALVVLVIFLFLRNGRATAIPSLALPMSIVGTFMGMYLMGYSLDNLSLMALTLSVGFVVDDAIVVLENIVRHVESGETVANAVLHGSREIGFTVVSMTLSLVAVFIPVLFMGGIVGRLLHEFAVTIGMAILISGFVSLSLTPMLCSKFLREHEAAHHGRLFQASERFFEGMVHFYERTLLAVMRHRPITLAVGAFVLVATAWLAVIIPKGFLPSEDLGQIFMFTEAAQGTSFESMMQHQKALADIVATDPNVDSFMSSVGAGGPNATGNTGRMFMRLKPRSQRKLDADDIIHGLRPKLAAVPGIMGFMQNPPAIRIGGQLTKSQYQLTLQGPDIKDLSAYATQLEGRLRGLRQLTDVTSDLRIKNPELNLEIDRDVAASHGLTARQVEDALQSAFATRQVSTIFAPTNQYQVILEVEPRFQRDPSALNLLFVRSGAGQLVPLSAVVHPSETTGALTVNHLGQLPSVTISFNLAPGVSLGDAVNAAQGVMQSSIPAGITTSFQGTAQAFQASLSGMGLLVLLAVVVIYVVLGILYESYVHPLTILSGLPSAGFGALLTLLLFHMPLDLYAFVGVILLVGIVKKNAIMMIDFALDAERRSGMSPVEAITRGALVRFRPIMMTTMAALMGTLPIALGIGAGAESRRPLGMAVVGGLVFSQLLTLYITPVVYTYLDALQARLRRRRKTAPAELQPSLPGLL
jgi:hydrophobic/amphiphilic exporter-1 (mainly G- bacteria), HAE1 family